MQTKKQISDLKTEIAALQKKLDLMQAVEGRLVYAYFAKAMKENNLTINALARKVAFLNLLAE